MSAIELAEEQENTNWGDNYSPSKDSPTFVAFHGRRQARIINGQNPMDNPEKFTPVVNPMIFDWPDWPADVCKEPCAFDCKAHLAKRRKTLFPTVGPCSTSPVALATSNTPMTSENAATTKLSVEGPPMPLQQEQL